MAGNVFLYPYDPTGAAATNRIVNERHNVQPPADINNQSFIVPRAAPFFYDSLRIRKGPTNVSVLLLEGVDYTVTHNFVSLSYVLGTPVYSSITFLNRNYAGEVFLTYQTLGGQFVLDDYSLIEQKTRALYNIFTVTWEQVSGLITGLPAYDHKMSGNDVVGFGSLVDSITNLAASIRDGGSGSGGGGSSNSSLDQHLNSNTGHTPSQVGLGNVKNYGVATADDVAANVNNRYMTPALTTVAITAALGNSLTTLSTGIQTNATIVQQHGQSLTDQATTLNNLTDDVETIGTTLDDQIDAFNTYKLSNNGVLTGLDTRLDTVESTLATLNTNAADTSQNVADVQSELLDLEIRVELLEKPPYSFDNIYENGGWIPLSVPAKNTLTLKMVGHGSLVSSAIVLADGTFLDAATSKYVRRGYLGAPVLASVTPPSLDKSALPALTVVPGAVDIVEPTLVKTITPAVAPAAAWVSGPAVDGGLGKTIRGSVYGTGFSGTDTPAPASSAPMVDITVVNTDIYTKFYWLFISSAMSEDSVTYSTTTGTQGVIVATVKPTIIP